MLFVGLLNLFFGLYLHKKGIKNADILYKRREMHFLYIGLSFPKAFARRRLLARTDIFRRRSKDIVTRKKEEEAE